MKTLRGKVAVVTGAAGGLGSALAQELASRGCNLALVDISGDALQQLGEALEHHDVRVTRHIADVTRAEEMRLLAANVARAHGGVNLLVNNAGITLQKNFATHSLQDWERVLGINLWGVIYGCHFFLPALRRAEEAHLVNLSSMSAFAGLPGQSSYCATKAAVKALSESIFAEWALEGIGVTSVHPGAIRTDMIKATLEESDDVAAAQRNYEFAHRTGVDAEHAARKIVEAVLKGKVRVRIGRDSLILDYAKRFAPASIHKLMIRIATNQAATS